MRESFFLSALKREAKDWESRGLRRYRKTLLTPAGPHLQLMGQIGSSRSFLSNDYLGLAAHADLREGVAEAAHLWGVVSGASPLVSGHMQCHADAEKILADFTGFEDSLLFITGYMANLAVITSLLTGPEDVVFSDSLNHASLIDACRLSRSRIERFSHLDTQHLAALLKATSARRRLIVTDAVFSMDGDCADLARLVDLAEEYDALVLVDDAHGFGVRGSQGKGSLAEDNVCSDRVILMATLGKAAGLSGAFVAATAFLIEHFVQRARTYIFSTSPSPALVGAIPMSLKLIQEGGFRREKLKELSNRFASGVATWRYPTYFYGTPIIPVLVGSELQTMHCVQALAQRGLLVAGIRPPTVPIGTSRLRISLTAAHDLSDVDALLSAAHSAGFHGDPVDGA
jgi:8-amino-7-oxononanoate synthase